MRIRAITGTRITKAPHAGIDDFWIPSSDHFIAQSQPIHHASSQVFQHRIGLITQLQEHGFVGLVLKIQAHTALVAINRCEGRTEICAGFSLFVGARMIRQKRWNVAITIARGWLNLNDIGTQVRQQARAKRPGQRPRTVNYG